MFCSSIFRVFNARVLLFCALVLLCGALACEEEPATPEPTGENPPQIEMRTVADYDYVSNQYFWFNHPSYNDSALLPDAHYPIDVFRSLTRDDITGGGVVYFPGQAFVDMFGTGSSIDAAMERIRNHQSKPPAVEYPFELLVEFIDYEFIYNLSDFPLVVGIKLKERIPENKALAVMYVNRSGQKIGGPFSDYGIPIDIYAGEKDTLALELIKPPYPRAQDEFGWTWNYMMRFFYDLGKTNMDPGSFQVTIEDVITPRADPTTPQGSDVPYLQIFGLDRYARNGEPGHDGEVDYREGALDLERGILMFPSLRPFAPDTSLVRLWTDGEFQFDGVYAAQYDSSTHLYSDYLPDPTMFHQYDIIVRVWR